MIDSNIVAQVSILEYKMKILRYSIHHPEFNVW